MKASRFRETEHYSYLNANPKGRIGCDCVVRAISLALGQPWEQTVREMTEMGLKRGYILDDPHLFPAYLESKGFIPRREPRDAHNKKVSVAAFLASHPDDSDFVAVAGSHHVTAVVGGKVRDIWDCSDQTMHRWWSKPKR